MIYELYYWPTIQGRGEFIRLALEDCGAAYVDVARQTKKRSGIKALLRLLDGKGIACKPFAPPFLKAGKLVIGQTANILLFLGARHRLAPANEAGRLWAHQLQLTLADFLQEVHDTHHPISGGLYYEDQRAAARRRAADFLAARAPKYLDYFEDMLRRNTSGGAYLLGARRSYPDLSLFQIVAGLRYAFPRAMAGLDRRHPRIAALHDTVASRPRIAAYLASDRRIPFNQQGIFRHYEALDAKPAR
jgi:glutathione S-transferase